MRAYNRFVVDKEIECVIGDAKDFVSLYNLSCGGCMIETTSPAIRDDAKVEIVLGELGKVHGRIVWRIEKNAGIKFEIPLHQKAVEFLGYSASGEDFDRHDPRDRFGIPLVSTGGSAGRIDG